MGAGVRFPTPLHEAVAAIRYLRKHADQIGIDPSKITSYGGSSGGWFSAMLAVSGSENFRKAGLLGTVGAKELHTVSSTVNCAIETFGPVEFATLDTQRESIQGIKPECNTPAGQPVAEFMGFPVLENLTEAVRASPLTYLGPSTASLCIAHGDSDLQVPVGQSRQFVKQAQELGIVHEYLEVHGAGHGTSHFGRESYMHWLLSFLEKHCRAEP